MAMRTVITVILDGRLTNDAVEAMVEECLECWEEAFVFMGVEFNDE